MNNWYDDAKRMSLQQVFLRLGMNPKANNRWGPCPICHNEVDETGHRPPVKLIVSGDKEGWICNASSKQGGCKLRGYGHFDLVSHHLFGISAKQLRDQGRFRELKTWYTNDLFIPKPEKVTHKVEYPPTDEVHSFLNNCLPIDKDVQEYFTSRNIHGKVPVKIANKDFDVRTLTKIQRDDYETPWWPTKWLHGYKVIIPLFNYKGQVISFVGRTIRKNYTRKTTVPIGFSTLNLNFMSPNVIEWLIGKKEAPSQIWFTEGEIDFLHLCVKGLHVIGIRSGSMGHLQLIPWKANQKCYIGTDNDIAGERYAKKIPKLVYPAVSYRVNFQQLWGIK